MKRLLKYLKPFLLPLMAAVILLFVQANADLALPDYMSRIVNVGIQQNGVERAIPQAMRPTTMAHLKLFLEPTAMQEVENSYRLVASSSGEAQTFLSQYPILATSDLYLLQVSDNQALAHLETVLVEPLVTVYSLELIRQDPSRAASLFGHFAGFDLSQLPSNLDLFTILAQLPQAERLRIRSLVIQHFHALGGEKALRQSAARAVVAEYLALGVQLERIQNAYLVRVGTQMLLISLLAAVATIVVGLLGSRIAAGFARDLRHLLFRKVMQFSRAEIEHFSSASLITRATNDITQVQNVTAIMVRMVFYAPIIGIGGILRALSKSPSMWWTIALAVGVLLLLIITAFSLALPKFQLIQTLVDRLNLIARENLSGMMVVRAFNRQSHEKNRFELTNRQLTDTNLFVNRLFVIMMPFMTLIMNGASLLIIWVGAHQVAAAQMQVGDMIAFMQYAMQIVFAFLMLSMLFIMFPRADVSALRIAEVIETPLTVFDPPQPVSFPEPFRPEIEFENVSFRYPDAAEDVLHNLSFRIEAGQIVGIMGTTGSGKSTLVNLIPRFYDATSGTIRIGGVDIRQVSLRELRCKIAYVPQHSNLFSGTIESNLRFANPEADEFAMVKALRIAQAEDFVLSRDEGLLAEVSQGGTNYSGGQRQRLSIARALVKGAPIYIFDDTFSALDYRTDSQLRQALFQSLRGSTVIIVSQRVATIKNSDQILILDQGRLVGKGTHQELMSTNDIYREIALSQLKEEALV